ncbi:MAG: 4-hydroxy-3-methylbut-2-enyl diphosphate reductase, partial [Lachnospiraceae bacterium]|nr:4-hydroxy-3-methylbut-2-enyl diphosphate reductase [Lachnospiraceae bacterium]
VHNESVVEMLEEKGVHTLRSEEDAALIPDGAAVLIRAHGIPKALEESLKKRNLHVIDATCPFVKKIHRIAEEHSAAGETVVIAGNPAHPEVVGIRGYCSGPSAVVSEPDEIEKILTDHSVKICLAAQTTFNHKKFKLMVEKIKNLRYNATIADTVCSATRERQEESEEIASRADVMIVIGGKESSNSQKLYEICKRNCNQTYFIQTAADLKDDWGCGVNIVGITAGASTPKTIIKEVQTNVRKF